MGVNLSLNTVFFCRPLSRLLSPFLSLSTHYLPREVKVFCRRLFPNLAVKLLTDNCPGKMCVCMSRKEKIYEERVRGNMRIVEEIHHI